MDGYFAENEQIRLMLCEHKDTELHNHDFLEMVYVTEGEALHCLNKAETIIKKGDYFIIEIGAFHKYKSVNNIKFTIINVLFKPEMIDKALAGCRSFQDLINHYLIRFSYRMLEKIPTDFIFHDTNRSVFALIEKLQSEYDKKSTGYIELMRCYLIEIIIQTMRRISKSDANKLYNDHCRYIISYIEENYMKPIALSDMSRELNFSLPYLCKKFKSDVGVTFNTYLQKKRIEHSCRLISNTDKKIPEIAELVGYKDTKFFNQVFKKHLKMTPGEFRKRIASK